MKNILKCLFFSDSNLMKYGWICASWGEIERVKHSKTYIRIYWLCRGLINHVLKDETHVNRKLLKGFTTKFIENYLIIIYQVSSNFYRCGTKWEKLSKYSLFPLCLLTSSLVSLSISLVATWWNFSTKIIVRALPATALIRWFILLRDRHGFTI